MMPRAGCAGTAWVMALSAAVVVGLSSPTAAGEKVVKVLMTTGDWKNQPWYQNRWMRDKEGNPRIFRGRYIEKKVEEVAPGKFAFTHIPNYIAQQYLDSHYLSQFDVLLIGDIMVHLSETFQTAARDFVRNGGGLLYCANHKWGIGMKAKGEPFEQTLPTRWPDRDEKGDYKGWLDNRNFRPVVLAPRHPALRGLDWPGAPPLGGAVHMPAEKGATVLLATPRVVARPWQILGPFPNENKTAFNTAYEPERGVDLVKAHNIPGVKGKVRWKKVNANAAGAVELVPHFTPNEYVCAYAVTYVKSPAARKVLCTGQADDGMKVWINGTLVPGDDKRDGAWPGKAAAELKAGWNEVLVKVTQDPGGWWFTLDLLAPDGKPMSDLTFSPRPGATPKEFIEPAPVLTAWQFGKGRAIFSASIFANGEQSEAFGRDWQGFGRYYAQVLAWLGANSRHRKVALKGAPAAVSATVDFTKPRNAFPGGVFSIHGNEGIRGSDVAMKHYMALNPKGAISRGGPCATRLVKEPEDVRNWGKYDFSKVDAYLAECREYGTEPIAHCHGIQYGAPKWLWKAGKWFGNATAGDAELFAVMMAAYIEHANKGRRGSAAYQLNVKYVDIGNEPHLDRRSIEGYMRIVKAVGKRVHRDYPGVLVGAYCPYRMEYVKPIYMFGVLWAGWGPKDVVGEKGTPIHDAYDAFWIWRDFRGQRVAWTKTLGTKGVKPQLLDHLHVGGSRSDGTLNALVYYDWAYDGTGYKDYARGLSYPRIAVDLKLILPASAKPRTLTISRATGEGFETVKENVAIPAATRERSETVTIEPLTAISVTIQ